MEDEEPNNQIATSTFKINYLVQHKGMFALLNPNSKQLNALTWKITERQPNCCSQSLIRLALLMRVRLLNDALYMIWSGLLYYLTSGNHGGGSSQSPNCQNSTSNAPHFLEKGLTFSTSWTFLCNCFGAHCTKLTSTDTFRTKSRNCYRYHPIISRLKDANFPSFSTWTVKLKDWSTAHKSENFPITVGIREKQEWGIPYRSSWHRKETGTPELDYGGGGGSTTDAGGINRSGELERVVPPL